MDEPVAVLHSSARRQSGPQRLLRAAGAGRLLKLRLSADMRADDAFRAILADCLTQASAHAGVLRAGRSVEALHQLRVSLRRLEVVLAAFGRAFGQDWFEELRGRVKVISARLGPARDLDVFLGRVWDKATAERATDFTPLRRAVEREQDKAWDQVELCVTSEDFGHLLDDIAALSQSRLPIGGEKSLRQVARAVLKAASRRVVKRGRVARTLEEGDLHRLRIAIKKLRYLGQFLAPLYDSKDVKRTAAALKRMQEQLGHLNDMAHARALIADLMRRESHAAIGYGAGLVAGHYSTGRKRRAKKALRRYDDFRKLKPFWKT